MSSPNLAAPHVAASQNQKEVTINDATDALDLAMTASLEVDCSAGGTIAVTTQQAQRHVRFVLGGTPAAAFEFQLPNVPRLVAISNGTGQTATVRNASGAAVEVAPGGQELVHASGTGVSRLGAQPEEAPVRVYDFGITSFDPPGALDLLGKVVLPRAMVLPANLAGAHGHVDEPPSATFDISCTRNGGAVATISIGVDGSFTFATADGAPVAIAAGDVFRFIAPDPTIPGIAGIAITLAGVLS